MTIFSSIAAKLDSSAYQRGWRPALGWTSTAGVVIGFVVYPLADLVKAIQSGCIINPYPIEQLLALIAFALGQKIVRTYEKVNNVAAGYEYIEEPADASAAIPETDEEEFAPWNTAK